MLVNPSIVVASSEFGRICSSRISLWFRALLEETMSSDKASKDVDKQ
jgi:hypothetical protein